MRREERRGREEESCVGRKGKKKEGRKEKEGREEASYSHRP